MNRYTDNHTKRAQRILHLVLRSLAYGCLVVAIFLIWKQVIR